MSLADDRAICEAATPGPWALILGGVDHPPWVGFQKSPGETWYVRDSTYLSDEDAAFIAHFTPAYVARLLDVVEAAEAVDASHEAHLPAAVGEAEALHAALAALKAVDE